jgi:FkbM family methyltransferase
MRLSRLLGTDLKETLKKIRYKYQNRNFVPYTVEKTLLKTDFKFYVANLDAQNWYLDEESVDPNTKEWMWPELEFVKNNITKTGDIVLECGGHHGLTAVVIAKWVGSTGHVYTFEPNPENLEIIAKNVEINDSKNITIVPNAVGSEPGEILVTNSSSNSYILTGNEHNGIKVPIVKVDDFIDKKPTVIKIDVEGFELEVLKGAKEVLKTLPSLHIELHPDMMERYGYHVEDLMALISIDYNLWIQTDPYKAPVPYNREFPITARVHLYAVAK